MNVTNIIGLLFWKKYKVFPCFRLYVPKWKSAGLWGSYGMKQGNPLKFIKTLIQLYLFYFFLYFWLTASKRVSKAIFLDIKFKSVGLWGSYSLKQGNILQFFQNTYPIVFVLFISLFLTYCIKESIKGNIFGH